VLHRHAHTTPFQSAALTPERISAGLKRPAPPPDSRDLHVIALAEGTRVMDAAVLVPIVNRAEGLRLLFTQRTPHLDDHAGQISFPGGRVDACDENPIACALREAEEEVGLPPPRTEVIGRLDTYQTRTGFEIVPVVGIVKPPFDLRPDPFEVAEAFEVPLDFILDPANHRRDSRVFQGAERHFWAMPFGTYYIWGATAGMLVNLSEVLRR
jgi:8-oxo-dGTP pyrophosphatase MutT (NUDIX family)